MNPSVRHMYPRSLSRMFGVSFYCVVALNVALCCASAESLSKPELLRLQFHQNLNAQVPLNLSFTNDNGSPVQLRDYFGRRPVILVLGYYGCPMLCGLVLNGVVESLQDVRGTAGTDFEVLFVSIDPRESTALAAAKKRTYIKRYGRPNTQDGWHFLTGQEPEIRSLCATIGFEYGYDSRLKQYAHPGGIVVLTPEGKASKYFFGVAYPATDLNAALKEAAGHRVGSRVQQLLILCFKHMPLMGRNSGTIMEAVRGLAIVTMLAIGAYVIWSVRREKRQRSLPQAIQMERAPP